jgi:hypothetical protein
MPAWRQRDDRRLRDDPRLDPGPGVDPRIEQLDVGDLKIDGRGHHGPGRGRFALLEVMRDGFRPCGVEGGSTQKSIDFVVVRVERRPWPVEDLLEPPALVGRVA